MPTAPPIPPSAASAGYQSRLCSRSSPRSISRLASSPTTRKKSAISPWFTHSCRVLEMPCEPIWIERCVSHSSS